MYREEEAAIGAGGWLPVPEDALKRPVLTLGGDRGAFSLVSRDNDGNWDLWAFHRG